MSIKEDFGNNYLPPIESDSSVERDQVLESELRTLEQNLRLGKPLSPHQVALYIGRCQVSRSLEIYGEPSLVKSKEYAEETYEGWKRIISEKREANFRPKSGWRVATKPDGWHELGDTYGGWGVENDYGFNAQMFALSRAEEMDEHNRLDRYDSGKESYDVWEERTNRRGRYAESLRSTAEKIAAPRVNIEETAPSL